MKQNVRALYTGVVLIKAPEKKLDQSYFRNGVG